MFDEEDEMMLRTFAASAATAVVLAQSVQSDRLRTSLAAAEAERRRWARELHDETLQGLAGVRLLLSSALRREDPDEHEKSMSEAVRQVEREIENLRAIVTELRPAALDELGLGTALEMLIDRHREHSGLQIESELTLPLAMVGVPRVDRELDNTVYRLVQEALTNVVKHAVASRVRVTVGESDGEMKIEIQDDGSGFDIDNVSQGFGMVGMLERVTLVGGTLNIDSDEDGTRVKASLPTRGTLSQTVVGSDSGQVASA
jgi:signal transduction histidine kinase